jgi:hypothetical protein
MNSRLFVGVAITVATMASVVSAQIPPPPPPGDCDLAACMCDGVDLSKFKDKIVSATGIDGYNYTISICDDLPNHTVPSGCDRYDYHAAVVKWKAKDASDCIEIGSLANCTNSSTSGATTLLPRARFPHSVSAPAD